MKRTNGIFYGWFIVLASWLILFSLWGSIVNTFGVFLKPVTESLGWTRAAYSVALGMGALAMALGAPFVGKMLDTIGARKTMLIGAVLCGIGVILLSRATQLWHLYILFTVVGLGLSASTSIPASFVVANWFDRKRGMAMGLMFTGTSLGGMVMNPTNTYLLQTFGWRRSYVILGIAMSLIAIPLILLLIKTRPSDMGLLPDGDEPAEKKNDPVTGQTLTEAIRTSPFWFVAANMFLINLMANAMGAHCIPYLTDIGYSQRAAGFAWAAALGCMAIGALSFGLGANRWGARQAYVFSCIMTAVGLGALLYARNYWLLALFVFIYGFPQGGPLPLTPLVTANCHGLANMGAIYGAQTLFSILGAAIGPAIVGKMYDTNHTYRGALLVLIVITLMSAYSIYRARPAKSAKLVPSVAE